MFEGDDVSYAVPADADAGGGEGNREEDGGDGFKAFMAVGVVFVGAAGAEFDANDDDNSGEHVGESVDGVGNHGGGMAENAGEKLEGGEEDVAGDGDEGGAGGDFLAGFGFHFSLRPGVRRLFQRASR